MVLVRFLIDLFTSRMVEIEKFYNSLVFLVFCSLLFVVSKSTFNFINDTKLYTFTLILVFLKLIVDIGKFTRALDGFFLFHFGTEYLVHKLLIERKLMYSKVL